MNNNDKLVPCPHCKGDAAYQQELENNVTTWLCWGCGLTTSSLMTKDSAIYKTALETLPELHKDLMYEDPATKYIWLPSTLTLPAKGMLFASGKSLDTWNWTAVKYDTATEKMDMKNAKEFDTTSFMDAAEHIGIFDQTK